jgi:hypothetical protein
VLRAAIAKHNQKVGQRAKDIRFKKAVGFVG